MEKIKGLRVLIVEDDLITQKINRGILSKAPITMTYCE